MSKFFSSKYDALTPYVPGEQPKERKYIKLNTNESPFPPSPNAILMAKAEAERLELYSDPECRDLIEKASELLNIDKDEIIFTNGSDDVLNFAFMAFCDSSHPASFPDITYGFYPVFAKLNGVPFNEIPVKDDFSIDINDYIGLNQTIFIANPNAPTGLALPISDIEKIVLGNPNNVVVIDEAYVDFGGESAVVLTKKYKNILVTRTFSKSRSMAGARLGFAVGSKELIKDLNTLRYSTNPYNINRMTMAAGIGSLMDDDYFKSCCNTIQQTREWTAEQLKSLGFTVTSSKANFLFAKHNSISGNDIYSMLKENGILVRHFNLSRIKDYNRISIGSMEQMQTMIETLKKIIGEKS